jgi:hypothetical protein
MEAETFLDVGCYSFSNGIVNLLATRSVGPRILSFKFLGGENIFAELPHLVIDCPGTDGFHFYGGHRLWHAPEEPRRTYLPDDDAVEVVALENGLRVTQPMEPQTFLQKTIEIRLLENSTHATVTHHIANYGLWPVTCAVWAITQFKTGGIAILPQARHDTGVLPNRSLALWPYTDMSTSRALWGREYVLVEADMEQPFKVGYPNPRGWLAYWWNGLLFVKRAPYQPSAEYYDIGSSSQCYCNDHFLELETLSPITTILPGDFASHSEIWELYQDVARPEKESDAQALVEKLDLDRTP